MAFHRRRVIDFCCLASSPSAATAGIWGIQAKTRVNTAIVAPNRANPEMVDNVAIGGWIDVRRVREDSRWAVFRRKTYRSDVAAVPDVQPLDPNEPLEGPLLMRDFCSKKLPPIEVVHECQRRHRPRTRPQPSGKYRGVHRLFRLAEQGHRRPVRGCGGLARRVWRGRLGPRWRR